MSAPVSSSAPGSRLTLGGLIATLTGSALMLSTVGCSSTPDAEKVSDIEVHVPTQPEADQAAAKSIGAANAEAEYRKLLEDLAKDD